jgi:hypothetical protein
MLNLLHLMELITLSCNISAYILYNVRGYSTTSDHQLYRYATADTVRIVNWFITTPITRNYIHSQLFLTLCHIYTAYNLTRQYSTLFSRSLHNTLDIFTL